MASLGWSLLFLAALLHSCVAQNTTQDQNIQVILQTIQTELGTGDRLGADPSKIPILTDQFQGLLDALNEAQGTEEEVRQTTIQVLNHPIIQQIIQATGLVDFQNSNGSSLLLSAASGGVVSSVRLMLASGAYVNLRDENGWTPLLYAARNNHSDVVKVLLEAGADPNIENWDYGDSSLGWAAYNGNMEIVQDLLACGAETDQVDRDGDTPLLLAVRGSHYEITKLLIDRGANVDAQNHEGWTSVSQAAQIGTLDIVRLLIQAGAQLEGRTAKYGDTALMWATAQGSIEIMRELLAAGAEVDVTNRNGLTALAMSISLNQPEAANILLTYGSDINQRARDGDSVLMEAVNFGREEMVEILLQHCPDMSVFNLNRKNVTILARQKSSEKIKNMINGHESMTCASNGQMFPIRSRKYDSCREQQCCHGMWRNTGRALASCGEPCTTPGRPSGTCVRVSECVRLDEVFTVTNAAQDVGRISRFLVDYRCAYQESNIHVCCPST